MNKLTLLTLPLLLTALFLPFSASADHPCLEGEPESSCAHTLEYSQANQKLIAPPCDDSHPEDCEFGQGQDPNQWRETYQAQYCRPPIEAYSAAPYRDAQQQKAIKFLMQECQKQIDENSCFGLSYSGEYENMHCIWTGPVLNTENNQWEATNKQTNQEEQKVAQSGSEDVQEPISFIAKIFNFFKSLFFSR